MSPPSFDNLINRFKASTRQAADQMSKVTRVAKLKMDIMTLMGERSRHLQSVGSKVYSLFSESGALDGAALCDRLRTDFDKVGRIDGQITDLEDQIADLQALVHTVRDEVPQPEGKPESPNQSTRTDNVESNK